MTDHDTLAQNDPDEEETATNVALNEPETGDADLNKHGLEASLRTSNAAYSLRRLEHDLKMLQSKWQTVEREFAKRDERLGQLQQEFDTLQREHESLESRKHELEHDIEEKQGAESAAAAHIEKIEAQNTDLRAHLQELQDYIDARKSGWDTLNAQLREHQDTIREISESLAEREETIARKEAEQVALAGNVKELERELAEAKGRLDEREQSHTDLHTQLAERESKVLELQAVLLESQSDQQSLQLELAAQRELVRALEDEVSNKQRDLNLLASNADRLSAIGDGIREIDCEIDERWTEQAAKRHEDSDVVFDAAPDGVMLSPEELFPDPAELAEHVLVCEDADRGGLIRYPLIRTEMTIGRSHRADIRLNSKFISREHARITVTDTGAIIEDAGSMNGFLVNSEPCTRHLLVHGDSLEIGKVKLRYLENANR